MINNLIFDLGANNGEDTEFYLLKGFRVVSVEASPVLFAKLRSKFLGYITTGQLVALNIGVWSEPSTLTFYVNLDNDHWSSFDPAYGCRDGTRHETIEIQCVTIIDLLKRFGTPHFMKIDIEGADRHVLAGLREWRELPKFISVEEFGVAAIDELRSLGYENFKLVPQQDKSSHIPPFPPKEGRYVQRRFWGTDSGLFGSELPGEWLDYADARLAFTTSIRNEDSTWLASPIEWYDVHATTGVDGLLIQPSQR